MPSQPQLPPTDGDYGGNSGGSEDCMARSQTNFADDPETSHMLDDALGVVAATNSPSLDQAGCDGGSLTQPSSPQKIEEDGTTDQIRISESSSPESGSGNEARAVNNGMLPILNPEGVRVAGKDTMAPEPNSLPSQAEDAEKRQPGAADGDGIETTASSSESGGSDPSDTSQDMMNPVLNPFVSWELRDPSTQEATAGDGRRMGSTASPSDPSGTDPSSLRVPSDLTTCVDPSLERPRPSVDHGGDERCAPEVRARSLSLIVDFPPSVGVALTQHAAERNHNPVDSGVGHLCQVGTQLPVRDASPGPDSNAPCWVPGNVSPFSPFRTNLRAHALTKYSEGAQEQQSKSALLHRRASRSSGRGGGLGERRETPASPPCRTPRARAICTRCGDCQPDACRHRLRISVSFWAGRRSTEGFTRSPDVGAGGRLRQYPIPTP